MADDYLKLTFEDNIAILTLNRPKKYALDQIAAQSPWLTGTNLFPLMIVMVHPPVPL